MPAYQKVWPKKPKPKQLAQKPRCNRKTQTWQHSTAASIYRLHLSIATSFVKDKLAEQKHRVYRINIDIYTT